MKFKRIAVVAVLFFILAITPACTPQTEEPPPVSTDLPTRTATPATAIPTAAPTDAPVPLPTPGASATPLTAPDLYVLAAADDGVLLGAISPETGAWYVQSDLDSGRMIQPLGVYRRNALMEDISLLAPTGFACPDGSQALYYPQMISRFPTRPFNALATSSRDWQTAMEGRITWLETIPQAYIDATAEWLTGQGIESPEVRIRSVVSVDLEQDGAAEVLIDAGYVQSHYATNAGDYSVILLRRLAGGAVETVPLAADISLSNSFDEPPVHYLTGVMDLNGDQVPELVLDTLVGVSRRTDVYTVVEGELDLVLSAPCRGNVDPARITLLDIGLYDLEPVDGSGSPEFNPPTPGRSYFFLAPGFPVLGGSRDGAWLNASDASQAFLPGAVYHVYNKFAWEGTTTAGAAEAFSSSDADCVFASIFPGTTSAIGDGQIALNAPWNALPVVPRPGNKTDQGYMDAIAALLSGNFEDKEIVITEVLVIDLDRDGVDEVVVAANLAPFNGYLDENYHIAAVLYPEGNGFEAVPLVEEYFVQAPEWSNGQFPGPAEYKEPPFIEQVGYLAIYGIYDLNGDGKMEVVIRNVQEPDKYFYDLLVVFEYGDRSFVPLFGYDQRVYPCSWIQP